MVFFRSLADADCGCVAKVLEPDLPELIEWAFDAHSRFLHDMQIDLGGLDLGMAKEILNRADVGSILKQVCGKRVSQHVRRDPFGDIGGNGGAADGLLEGAW
jgi:hypothetical protein